MDTGTMDSGTTGQKTKGQRIMRLWATRALDNGALRHLDRTVDNESMDSGTTRLWDGGAVDDGKINNGTFGSSGSGQWYKEIKRPWGNGKSEK